MGLQEHDLMAAKKVSEKTVKKSIFPRFLDIKRLRQVSKCHLKIQKMQKQWIRKILSQWHFKNPKKKNWNHNVFWKSLLKSLSNLKDYYKF